MESTTIAFRVDKDVKDRIEKICNETNVSKSKLLSDFVKANFSDKESLSLNNHLSDLQKLLFKLKRIVFSDYNEYIKLYTPCIMKGCEDDGEYEGADLILIGDDTQVREKDGKFYIYDFNNTEVEPILLSEEEVLEFYKGQYETYGTFPSLTDSSYQYVKGYLGVMRTLIPTLEEEFEKHSNI